MKYHVTIGIWIIYSKIIMESQDGINPSNNSMLWFSERKAKQFGICIDIYQAVFPKSISRSNRDKQIV